MESAEKLGGECNMAQYALFWVTGTIATGLHDVDFTAYWIEAVSILVVLLKMGGGHCQRRGPRPGTRRWLLRGDNLPEAWQFEA